MSELVSNYIYELRHGKLSKNTVDAYERDLRFFEGFLKENNEDIKEISEMTIMAYVQHMKKKGSAGSSIMRATAAIRSFYKHLLKNGIINKDPVISYESINPKKRPLPEILTVEEVDILLSVPDISTDKGKRDKAIMEVMYGTGLKVSELVNLNMDDININLNYVRCNGSKGRERIVPIGSCASKALKQYFPVRDSLNIHNVDSVFLNSRGETMSRQGFWKIIKFYVKEGKIDKDINPNTLRHSFAVHLLQNGADIRSIQELLGYSDISAAEIYYSVSKKNRIYEVYKKTHPRA